MNHRQAGRVKDRQRRLELGRKHEIVTEIDRGKQGGSEAGKVGQRQAEGGRGRKR